MATSPRKLMDELFDFQPTDFIPTIGTMPNQRNNVIYYNRKWWETLSPELQQAALDHQVLLLIYDRRRR